MKRMVEQMIEGGPVRYAIIWHESTDECLVIRDLGPWDRHKTVTNEPEWVVADLVRRGHLRPGQRLEYYDSLNQRDEIRLTDDLKFAGFAPARTMQPSP